MWAKRSLIFMDIVWTMNSAKISALQYAFVWICDKTRPLYRLLGHICLESNAQVWVTNSELPESIT